MLPRSHPRPICSRLKRVREQAYHCEIPSLFIISFSNGSRLDEHEAQRTDPDNFNPEKELRDYAEVGRSLPVFCISSRAYQSLANGERVVGFRDIDDTEIPQLRAHTKKLTEATRIRHAKSFLNDLAQTLNSLYLWSSKKDIEIYLTDEEKKAEMGYLRERVNELEKV